MTCSDDHDLQRNVLSPSSLPLGAIKMNNNNWPVAVHGPELWPAGENGQQNPPQRRVSILVGISSLRVQEGICSAARGSTLTVYTMHSRLRAYQVSIGRRTGPLTQEWFESPQLPMLPLPHKHTESIPASLRVHPRMERRSWIGE